MLWLSYVALITIVLIDIDCILKSVELVPIIQKTHYRNTPIFDIGIVYHIFHAVLYIRHYRVNSIKGLIDRSYLCDSLTFSVNQISVVEGKCCSCVIVQHQLNIIMCSIVRKQISKSRLKI